MIIYDTAAELAHYGIKGMKWGVRRYQNPDGSLTAAGRERYGVGIGKESGLTIDRNDHHIRRTNSGETPHKTMSDFSKNERLCSQSLTDKEIQKEVVDPVNPNYGKVDGSTFNCAYCSTAYIMRRTEGYDVGARMASDGGGLAYVDKYNMLNADNQLTAVMNASDYSVVKEAVRSFSEWYTEGLSNGSIKTNKTEHGVYTLESDNSTWEFGGKSYNFSGDDISQIMCGGSVLQDLNTVRDEASFGSKLLGTHAKTYSESLTYALNGLDSSIGYIGLLFSGGGGHSMVYEKSSSGTYYIVDAQTGSRMTVENFCKKESDVLDSVTRMSYTPVDSAGVSLDYDMVASLVDNVGTTNMSDAINRTLKHGGIMIVPDKELKHYGIKGMKWGVRRYQNYDGSLTAAGRERYGVGASRQYQNADGSLTSDGYSRYGVSNKNATNSEINQTIASNLKSNVADAYYRQTVAAGKGVSGSDVNRDLSRYANPTSFTDYAYDTEHVKSNLLAAVDSWNKFSKKADLSIDSDEESWFQYREAVESYAYDLGLCQALDNEVSNFLSFYKIDMNSSDHEYVYSMLNAWADELETDSFDLASYYQYEALKLAQNSLDFDIDLNFDSVYSIYK